MRWLYGLVVHVFLSIRFHGDLFYVVIRYKS